MNNNLLDTEGYKYALKNMGIRFTTESDLYDKEQILYGYFLSAVFSMVIFFPGTFFIRNWGDWTYVIETVMVFTSITLISTKLLSFTLKKNKFFKLIKVVENLRKDGKKISYCYFHLCFSLMFLVEFDKFGKATIIDTNRLINKVVKVFYYSLFSSFSSFVLFPFCEHTYQLITKSGELRDLPLTYRLPFINTTKTPNYEIGSMVICVENFIATNIHAAVDGMFLLVSLNLKAHFQILQQMFRESPFKHQQSNESYLKYLINYHKSIILATDDLNDTFKEVIFVQISLSALNICFITILVIQNPLTEILFIIPNFLYLISILVQLCFYCFGGSLITSESFKVSVAIQESNWYNLSTDERKLVGFVMSRAQKPLEITSVIFVASMENYMMVRFFLNFIIHILTRFT